MTSQLEMLASVGIVTLVGFCLGLLWDALCFVGGLFPARGAVRAFLGGLSEILYILFGDIVFILSLYYLNRGKFRLLFLLALFSGLIIYRLTLSRAVRSVGHRVQRVILAIFAPVFGAGAKVLAKICGLWYNCVCGVKNKIMRRTPSKKIQGYEK